MKRFALHFALFALFLTPWASAQQDAPPPPPPHAEDGMSFPGYHEGGGPRRGMPPLKMYMEQLRASDPVEFERLSALQKDNPAAFRDELREKLQRKAIEQNFEGMPRVREHLENLSPDEREELFQRVIHAGRSFREGPGRPDPEKAARMRELQEKGRELARQYREAGEEDRPAIADRLRAQLIEEFDAKESEKAKRLEFFEKQVSQLRQELENRANSREKIIDRRLREMLETDELRW